MPLQKSREDVELLIDYGRVHLGLLEEDVIYARNKLLFLLKLGAPADEIKKPRLDVEKLFSPEEILDPLLDYAISKKIIKPEERLCFETTLIDAVCPLPSAVISTFDQIAAKNIKGACDYLYDFCFKSNYIRSADLKQNLKWKTECEKGIIEVTINVSKPEKNNKDIAASRNVKSEKYPKCPLCIENVGCYEPPYRQTLRTIPITLRNEQWYFQFSPYKYFDEHSIVFPEEHRPMLPSPKTVARLFDFVELFPHYFMGSNAALPIIGGSILSHDHFQGGAYNMPMFAAKPKYRFAHDSYPNVRVTIPDWYNNVIRLESRYRTSVEEVAEIIRKAFTSYNDETADLLCETITKDGSEQHSATSPIARFNADGEYCLDIFLRNNRTSEKFPDGIFHVSPDLHNIKQESIGLIEAMGVFILPGRLSREAEMIIEYLTHSKKLDINELGKDKDHPLNKHLGFLLQLLNDNKKALTPEQAEQCVEQAINKACERILKCTALFKETKEGQSSLLRFMRVSGFEHLK